MKNDLLSLFSNILINMISGITRNATSSVSSSLPPSTAIALQNMLPNVPFLIKDSTDVIIADKTNVSNFIEVSSHLPVRSWKRDIISLIVQCQSGNGREGQPDLALPVFKLLSGELDLNSQNKSQAWKSIQSIVTVCRFQKVKTHGQNPSRCTKTMKFGKK